MTLTSHLLLGVKVRIAVSVITAALLVATAVSAGASSTFDASNAGATSTATAAEGAELSADDGGELPDPAPDAAPGDSCGQRVDAPHISTGAGGVIAKPAFYCPTGKSRTIKSWIGNLYMCPQKPQGSAESTWTRDYGCSSIATNSSTNDGGSFTVASGATVKRYIPKVGSAGRYVKGAWYIACVRGTYGSSTSFAAASIPRQL